MKLVPGGGRVIVLSRNPVLRCAEGKISRTMSVDCETMASSCPSDKLMFSMPVPTKALVLGARTVEPQGTAHRFICNTKGTRAQ